jgi:hypothetical protein
VDPRQGRLWTTTSGPRDDRSHHPPRQGEPKMGMHQDPGRASQARDPGRGEHSATDPAPLRSGARPSPQRSYLGRVPAGTGQGSAGLRLLHGEDRVPEDALRPVLHRAALLHWPRPRHQGDSRDEIMPASSCPTSAKVGLRRVPVPARGHHPGRPLVPAVPTGMSRSSCRNEASRSTT